VASVVAVVVVVLNDVGLVFASLCLFAFELDSPVLGLLVVFLFVLLEHFLLFVFLGALEGLAVSHIDVVVQTEVVEYNPLEVSQFRVEVFSVTSIRSHGLREGSLHGFGPDLVDFEFVYLGRVARPEHLVDGCNLENILTEFGLPV